MSRAIIRVLLTVSTAILALLVVPILYTGLSTHVQFRHTATILDLQNSVARPWAATCAFQICQFWKARFLVFALLSIVVTVAELYGFRSRKLWGERLTYVIWGMSIGLIYFLMLGVAQILITI
jgi:hypothetical protein